jgi:hypothetical protein
MLINFTDATTGNSVAVNPQHVVCVFTNKDEKTGLTVTVINVLNGNIAVDEDYDDVLGKLVSK